MRRLFVLSLVLWVSASAAFASTRYRVALILYPGDDAAAVARQVAATYGGRLEEGAEGGRSVTVELSESQNMQWLQRQIADGAKIYDVGVNVARRDAGSAFNKAEVQALQNAGYTRQFVKLIEVDGKMYRLYQWVAPAK